MNARTTSEETINRWWSQADYNIGIVPEDAGWAVIDVDFKHGGLETWDALVKANPTPPTRTIITPNGGKHLYFYGSVPGTVGKLGKGVDTRGRGTYVLVPPSSIGGVEYREAE